VRLECGESVPAVEASGRKRRACDGCAALKRACNGRSPCATCLGKDSVCSYGRLVQVSKNDEFVSDENERCKMRPTTMYSDLDQEVDIEANPSAQYMGYISYPDFSMLPNVLAHGVFISNEREQSFNTQRLPQFSIQSTSMSSQALDPFTFEFLIHFTTSSGLATIFNYVTTDDSRRPCGRDSLASSAGQESATAFTDADLPIDAYITSQDTFQAGFQGDMDVSLYNVTPLTELETNVTNWPLNSFSGDFNLPLSAAAGQRSSTNISSFMDWLSHPLFSRTKGIWDALRQPMTPNLGGRIKNVDSKDRSDQECLEFFNPFNIEKFLNLFWNCWYCNCPVIHRPSFDALKAPMRLLLLVVLIGAFMSSEPQDKVTARQWLDPAEELVFEDEWLSGEAADRHDDESNDRLRSKLKTLQAALLICVLQNWEGTATARRRIRQRQYPSVIAVGRSSFILK
jgi:hypothetical protein